MSFPKWPIKDPDDILDYRIDWTDRLAGDMISTSTWIIEDTALVNDDDEHDDTEATIWLSGGVIDVDYVVTNRITTTGGRTMDQSVILRVRAK